MRNLLEWETMAQSEIAGAPRFAVFDLYLYVSSLLWLPFLFLAGPLPIIVLLVCALWITAPLVAGWLNEPLPKSAAITPKDRDFLREAALRTWRVLRGSFLGGASLAGLRQHSGKPVAGDASHFAHGFLHCLGTGREAPGL